MKNYTKESFLEKLGDLEFPDYSNFNCVSEAYSNFTTKLMDVIDKIAPTKEIRIKGNSKAWFDSDIVERINIREKLKKKHKKSGLQIDFDNLKTAQRQAKQIIK